MYYKFTLIKLQNNITHLSWRLLRIKPQHSELKEIQILFQWISPYPSLCRLPTTAVLVLICSTGLPVTSLSSDFVINKQHKLSITSSLKYFNYKKMLAHFPSTPPVKQWPRSGNSSTGEKPWIWQLFLHSIYYRFEQHMSSG